MNKWMLATIMTVCTVGAAQADLCTFDFEALNPGDGAAAISAYMSARYPGDVTVTGAQVANSSVMGADPDYITNVGSGTHPPIRITFDIPVVSAQFEAGVLAVCPIYEDFEFEVFNAASNPVVMSDGGGAVIPPGTSASITSGGQKWIWLTNWQYNLAARSPLFIFAEPVTTLQFHNYTELDIGVDNLAVTAVPVPAAVLLGLLGLSAAGWKVRRFA